MPRLNKISLIGFVGNDPKIETFPSGDQRTRVSIATDESYTDKQTQQRNDVTEWHPLEFTNARAKIAADNIKKGDLIYVEGKLRTYKIQPDGVDKPITQHVIRVSEVQFLTKRDRSQQAAPAQQPAQQPAAGYYYSDGKPFGPQHNQAARAANCPIWPPGYPPHPTAMQIQGVY